MKKTKLYLKEIIQPQEKTEDFVLVEPAHFEGTFETGLYDSIKLGELVNSFFKSLSDDYEGCFIEPDNYSRVTCNLYFQDNVITDSSKLKAIKSLKVTKQEARKSSIYDRSLAIQNRNSARAYDFEDQAKGLLANFLPRTGNGKVDWNKHVVEVKEPISNFGGQYKILVKVSNVDVNKLVRAIFGRYEEDGDKFEYLVTMVRPNGMPQAKNFVWNVQKLNVSVVDRMYKELGAIPQNGIQMFRVR